jgi:hypothetical protein
MAHGMILSETPAPCPAGQGQSPRFEGGTTRALRRQRCLNAKDVPEPGAASVEMRIAPKVECTPAQP